MSVIAPAAVANRTMTGEEFLKRYGDESGVELVDGVIKELDMPGLEHGEISYRASRWIGNFVMDNKLGRMFINDPFVRTRSNPDRFRGADVLYIAFESFAADLPTPKGAFTPPLELVVEVRSPSDSYKELTDKAFEYLDAGVKVVLVVDPESRSAGVFRSNELPQRFTNGDELTLPDILPGFSVPVRNFFE